MKQKFQWIWLYYTDRISNLYMPYWVQLNKLLAIEIDKNSHENLSNLWRNLLYRLDIQSLFLYRVSHKKLHLVLEGCSTPKFWARNKSQVCFGILRFSAFQNCPYFWLLTHWKLRYLMLKTPGVIFRNKIFVLQLHKVFILYVTPGVFNIKYLSF